MNRRMFGASLAGAIAGLLCGKVPSTEIVGAVGVIVSYKVIESRVTECEIDPNVGSLEITLDGGKTWKKSSIEMFRRDTQGNWYIPIVNRVPPS